MQLRWWNCRTFVGGRVKDPMMEEWNNHGGTVEHQTVDHVDNSDNIDNSDNSDNNDNGDNIYNSEQ